MMVSNYTPQYGGYGGYSRLAPARDAQTIDPNAQGGGALVAQSDPNATPVYPQEIVPASAPKSNNNLWGWAAAAAGTAIVATTVIMSNNKTKALEKALEEAKNLAPNNVTTPIANAVADAGHAVQNGARDAFENFAEHTGSYLDGIQLDSKLSSPKQIVGVIIKNVEKTTGVKPLNPGQERAVTNFFAGGGNSGRDFGFNYAEFNTALQSMTGGQILGNRTVKVTNSAGEVKEFTIPKHIKDHVQDLRLRSARGTDAKALAELNSGRMVVVGAKDTGEPVLAFRNASGGKHYEAALEQVVNHEDKYVQDQAVEVAKGLGYTLTKNDSHVTLVNDATGVKSLIAHNFNPDLSDLSQYTFKDAAGNNYPVTKLEKLRDSDKAVERGQWEALSFTPSAFGDGTTHVVGGRTVLTDAGKPTITVNASVEKSKRVTPAQLA
jgi:hypothetical protein